MAKLRQTHARKNGSAASAPAAETNATPAAASILREQAEADSLIHTASGEASIPTEPLSESESVDRFEALARKYPDQRPRLMFDREQYAFGYLIVDKLRRECREELERLLVYEKDRPEEPATTAELQHLLDFLRDWRTHGCWGSSQDGGFYTAALRSLASLAGISPSEARERLFPDQEDPAA